MSNIVRAVNEHIESLPAPEGDHNPDLYRQMMSDDIGRYISIKALLAEQNGEMFGLEQVMQELAALPSDPNAIRNMSMNIGNSDEAARQQLIRGDELIELGVGHRTLKNITEQELDAIKNRTDDPQAWAENNRRAAAGECLNSEMVEKLHNLHEAGAALNFLAYDIQSAELNAIAFIESEQGQEALKTVQDYADYSGVSVDEAIRHFELSHLQEIPEYFEAALAVQSEAILPEVKLELAAVPGGPSGM